MTSVIETLNLSKTYKGGVEALKSLDLKINRGESVGFLGPNGAGKTTTIQILLNLIKPTTGNIWLFDELTTGQERELLDRVGALVAMPGYYNNLSAHDMLDYVGKVFRMPQAQRRERIEETLELVGLSEAGTRRVGNYSTGMKRRLGIAQILLHDPELIILDEPTNGLDPKGVREVRNLISRINKTGKTVFMTTHNLNEVDELSERVIFLDQGAKVGDEKMAALKSKLGANQIEIKFNGKISSSHREMLLDIEHVEDIIETDSTYLSYRGNEGTAEQILREITREQLPLYSFRPLTLTLEDIYLRIYGAPQEAGA